MPTSKLKPHIPFAFSIIICLSMLTSAQPAEAKGGRWSTDTASSDTESTTTTRKNRKKRRGKTEPVEEPPVIEEPPIVEEPPVIEEPEPVDTLPPTINLPSDISLEATNALGALATYSVSSSDNFDNTVNGELQPNSQVSCLPASGSVLAIGQHTIQCNAVDVAGNSANGSFNIEIADTTEPSLVLPLDAWGDSADGLPTAITYQVATYDQVDIDPQLQCLPASGELFTVGETQVNCSAQDSLGNSTSGSFIVSVYDVSPVEPEPPLTPNNNSTVVLSWQTEYTREDGSTLLPEDISSYEIAYGTDQSFSDAQLQSIPAIGSDGNFSNQLVLESIEAGSYYFAISVIDQNGLPSSFSKPIAVNVE